MVSNQLVNVDASTSLTAHRNLEICRHPPRRSDGRKRKVTKAYTVPLQQSHSWSHSSHLANAICQDVYGGCMSESLQSLLPPPDAFYNGNAIYFSRVKQ